MKNKVILSLGLAFTALSLSAQVQLPAVNNDPLKAKIYKLDNGLMVYFTVYKDAPRIETRIAVKAGSKNDPADATGLAHYLEHMLFKGTDKYGSKDYSKEKPELDKITELYEVYRSTTDSLKRKMIYHQIDSISGVAATYAIANEYDKMVSVIGAEGTNAYTSFEQTVYVNDIPSNQIDKWLTLEAERFRNPEMRLFHTELEAVYEEKNRHLDNDGDKLWEALFAGLFQKHTYGTQTTIGTIEHLKNPSIKKIMDYYHAYYVPNNMAICLSGDFDPDSTLAMIKQKFGAFKAMPVPAFTSPVEDPILKPVVKDVYGPDAETMALAFRFGGASSKDADMLTLVDKLLYNGTAGLIDLNLNQQQKVLGANSFPMILKDYSLHLISGDPREGQTLDQVKELLLSQLELIKKGEFPDWMLKAAVNDLKLQQTRGYEDNGNRVGAFVSAFTEGIDWKDYTAKINRLSAVTKQEVIDFVKKNYENNYVIIYKHTGEDKNVKKVEKPAITPVAVNRNDISPFVQNIINAKSPEIKPEFLDYKENIKFFPVKNNLEAEYTLNKENNLFNLFFVLDMGTVHDKKMSVALAYLPYLGTSKYNPVALKQEFYKLGCNFDVSSSEDQTYVTLTGLNDNFEAALALFENLLSDPQPDKAALDNLVQDELKKRADAKLSKQAILWNAMYNYAKFGPKSPFTNILSEAELKALKPEELTGIIKSLLTYQHRVLYYGPSSPEQLTAMIVKHHNVPASLLPLPAGTKFGERSTADSMVFVVNYDMKQAEIIMLSKGDNYHKDDVPLIQFYNEYFGGGMSSIVFQEMRESKALAYSVFSSYTTPKRKEKPHYVMAYIGTQADKLPEAMSGMMSLLNSMPESSLLFSSAKNSLMQKIRTERITKSDILFNYEQAKKLGLNYDIRRDVFTRVPDFTMTDLQAFQGRYVKGKSYTVIVLGDKNKLDLATLGKYGKVKFLTMEDIFGY